jgi:hypothetical protein
LRAAFPYWWITNNFSASLLCASKAAFFTPPKLKGFNSANLVALHPVMALISAYASTKEAPISGMTSQKYLNSRSQKCSQAKLL